MKLLLRFTCMIAALFFLATATLAFSLEGKKTISLKDNNGTLHKVATIDFLPGENYSTYSINWKDAQFSEHFLSMRPFRCLEGDTKHWCRVPYPYENKRAVSKDDLTDLEYDLLFIWKGGNEYGINMWNGVYYQLEIQDGRLIGKLNEMDMDKLGVPPEQGNLRPIREVDLEAGDPDSHWLPTLVIE